MQNCGTFTFVDAAGVFFLAGAFFLTLTSESELSELLWLSLDDSEELKELDQPSHFSKLKF